LNTNHEGVGGVQVWLHAFLISSLDGGAVSFTPGHYIQRKEPLTPTENLRFEKKYLLHMSQIETQFLVCPACTLVTLSGEFPRTLSLDEYHRRLESIYFMSTLLEDSYLMRYAILTG
jgi:hypothetical protein